MSISLVIFTIILAIIGDSVYVWSIIKGKTKPNFSGWAIFTLSMSCVLFSSYYLGAKESLIIVALFTFIAALITFLSLKYGKYKISNFEKILLSLSIISVILWLTTNNPWYALLINTFVDTLGFISIIYKLYLHPETEDSFAWTISFLVYGLNLIIITNWALQEYLFSLTNAFWCFVILILSFRKKNNKIIKKQKNHS